MSPCHTVDVMLHSYTRVCQRNILVRHERSVPAGVRYTARTYVTAAVCVQAVSARTRSRRALGRTPQYVLIPSYG